MNSQPIFWLSLSFSLLILFTNCNKSDEEQVVILTNQDPSSVTETSFTANWSINSSDLKSLRIEVSSQQDFSSIFKTVTVQNTSLKSESISDLHGATVYYYRIIASLNNGNSVSSEVKKVMTIYKTESVTFITSDNLQIAAKLKYLESNSTKGPGIIFMHELGVFVNNWNNAELVTSLIAQGNVCMVLDFRGHGQSDAFELQDIADNIGVVAPDLIAAIDFLKSHKAVNPQKLALVGGSLGAIMSIAGNGYEEVKCSVSLSGGRNGIYSIFQNLEIESAFFIVGELDNGGGIDFPNEAAKLYEIAKQPKKLKTIAGNSAHGTNLLVEDGLNQEIIDWINLCFTNN